MGELDEIIRAIGNHKPRKYISRKERMRLYHLENKELRNAYWRDWYERRDNAWRLERNRRARERGRSKR